MDIYDGDNGPVVYHGRTFTSKVPVRDICGAIIKYAFIASPYPIIISAEIHCGVPQQEQLVEIMKDVFGDALVYAPVEGRPRIAQLPSPGDLRGRVLLKTKNLYLVAEKAAAGGSSQAEQDTVAESETTTTTESDTDFSQEIKHEIKHEWRRARENEAEIIKGVFRSSCVVLLELTAAQTLSPSSRRHGISSVACARRPRRPPCLRVPPQAVRCRRHPG